MNKRTKILHIIESLGRSGAEKRLADDLKYLDKDKFENMVCSLYSTKDMIEGIPSDIRLACLDMRGITDFYKGFKGLLKIIRFFKPDIIHTQLFGANLYGRIIGRLFSNAKIVTTFQYPDYEKDTETEIHSHKRYVIDFIVTNMFCDKVIAVSNYVKKSVGNKLRIKGCEVIYNYLNAADLDFKNIPESEKNKLRKTIGLEEEDFVLINIGRLVPQKGQRGLLEAFVSVLEKIPRAKLIIVGQGPLLEELQNLTVRLGISSKVIFLGKRRDIYNLLSISNLFVFTSINEGLGVVLLEAMAASLPCIAYNVGPIPEIIKDRETGYLVPKGDKKNMAESIYNIFLNYDEAITIGKKARRYVEENFCAKVSVSKLEDLYSGLFKK